MRNGIRKAIEKLNFGMDKVIPDSFIFAVILTVIVYLMGIFIAKATPFAMLKFWAEGFWNFLSFGMQMTLVLATGFTLGTSPAGERFLKALSKIPKNSLQAVIFIALVSAIVNTFHWGLGMIVPAFLVRELAKNLKRLDFKLLVAAAYAGTIGGGLGFSGSEFLIVNAKGHFLESVMGVLNYGLTVLYPAQIIPYIICAVIIAPLLWFLVHPSEENTPLVDPAVKKRFLDQDAKAEEAKANAKAFKDMTVAEKLDSSPVFNLLVAVPGLIYFVYWVSVNGANMTLNILNFLLLMLGILLHWTPRSMISAFEEGTRNAFGIVLQFPFYAGIQGMMGSSGLIVIIANAFVSISTPVTYPIWNYFSASLVNLFVPSSGGIFMIQGPVMMQAGASLGLPANETLIAFTAGETISNVIQPFWAIPLLGIVGLKMKDIMGYCIVAYIIYTIIYLIAFATLFAGA